MQRAGQAAIMLTKLLSAHHYKQNPYEMHACACRGDRAVVQRCPHQNGDALAH
jgi:hypothetical protein